MPIYAGFLISDKLNLLSLSYYCSRLVNGDWCPGFEAKIDGSCCVVVRADNTDNTTYQTKLPDIKNNKENCKLCTFNPEL